MSYGNKGQYCSGVTLPKVVTLPNSTEILVHDFRKSGGILEIQGSFTKQWWGFTGEAAAFILAQLEPEGEDGPWAEGWEERSNTTQNGSLP